MLQNLKNYVYPTDLDECIEYLKKPNSRPIAGGTALTLLHDSSIETLVDLSFLDLSYIKEEKDHFRIGAMTSAYDIAFHPSLPSALKQSARKIGDVPLIHAVTIGGNLAEIYPWCDFPPVLLVLNAKIKVLTPTNKQIKEFTISDFLTGSLKAKSISSLGLIIEIIVPKPPKNSFNSFQKFTFTEIEKSQANLAVYLEWDPTSKTIIKARISVSALTKHPQQVEQVEKVLLNSSLDKNTIDKAVTILRESITIVPNFLSSKEYRKEIIGVFLKRALDECKKEMSK